jgi:integrase
LAPKTVRNIHTMLHVALANAVRWHDVPQNVAEAVKPPKVRRRKPTVWSPDQLHTFVVSVQGDRFFALYLLAATTGLRRAELCGLRWPAVDLASGSLSVEPDTRVVVNGKAQDSDGKTDQAPRMLALDPVTVAALTEWKANRKSERAFFETDYQDTDRVFTWGDGRPVHPGCDPATLQPTRGVLWPSTHSVARYATQLRDGGAQGRRSFEDRFGEAWPRVGSLHGSDLSARVAGH